MTKEMQPIILKQFWFGKKTKHFYLQTMKILMRNSTATHKNMHWFESKLIFDKLLFQFQMEINVNQKLIPSFRHPYSRTKKIHLLPKRSNYDEPGKFAFRIDGTTVEEAYGKFLIPGISSK